MSVRKVRTPAGAKRYNLPIGSPIKPSKPGSGLASKAKKVKGLARLDGPTSSKSTKSKSGRPQSARTAQKAAEGARKRQATVERRKSIRDKKADTRKRLNRDRIINGPAPWDPEDDFAKRGEWVDEKISGMVDAGKSTDVVHKRRNADGTISDSYTAERAQIHNEILDEMWKRGGGDKVPRDRKALFTGGAGGSGKGFVLKTAGIKEGEDYVTVNADEVKEIMAERGLIPVPDGVAPMEGVALVHEESSDVATMFAERLQREGVNMIWDITMGKASQVQKRITKLKENGYEDIRGMYVDVPLEVSVENAKSRYANGMKRLADGVSDAGGRRVPPHVIMASASDTPGITKNRQAFDAVRDEFTVAERWDNNRFDENGNKLPPIKAE